MAVGTMGAGAGLSPLTSKAGGWAPLKWPLSLEVNTRFNSLQSYTCLNPMIIVKLTSKVHKNMFEHAKNKKIGGGGGVSLDTLAALAPSALEEPT